MEKLTQEQRMLISSLLELLNNRGIKEVNVDLHSKSLFPKGITTQNYNEIVPALVESGHIKSGYDSPRDGPIISLTPKAIEQFG